MHARLVLLCAAVASGSLSATAVAAPKPVCNLVTDIVGDEWEEADSGVRPPGLSEPTMDLVSGDIASNAKWVTVAIRPKKIGRPSAPFESVTLGSAQGDRPRHRCHRPQARRGPYQHPARQVARVLRHGGPVLPPVHARLVAAHGRW